MKTRNGSSTSVAGQSLAPIGFKLWLLALTLLILAAPLGRAETIFAPITAPMTVPAIEGPQEDFPESRFGKAPARLNVKSAANDLDNGDRDEVSAGSRSPAGLEFGRSSGTV